MPSTEGGSASPGGFHTQGRANFLLFLTGSASWRVSRGEAGGHVLAQAHSVCRSLLPRTASLPPVPPRGPRHECLSHLYLGV